MPDLQALAAQMSRAESTPEEIEEEQRVIRQQVETAHGWLNDADSGQRVAGAEQLSAFPTPEAERYLAEALRHDPVPEVRAAAAQSLGVFEKLQDSTVLTLLDSLADREEDVRRNVLYTLENNYLQLERDSPAAKKLLSDLQGKAKSRRVAKGTRELIREFVREQK
jgi:HEAT repeat protein